MKPDADKFLSEWTARHVQPMEECPDTLDAAAELARRCRKEAAAQGVDEVELTVAAFGNLVVYFKDEIFRLHMRSQGRRNDDAISE